MPAFCPAKGGGRRGEIPPISIAAAAAVVATAANAFWAKRGRGDPSLRNDKLNGLCNSFFLSLSLLAIPFPIRFLLEGDFERKRGADPEKEK